MAASLSIAKHFSEVPAGRFITDGPFSGEKFRDQFLKPALEKGPLTVDLDGTEGYGSSFLEEAFGGLVRLGYFSAQELHDRLTLRSRDKALVEEIWDYIDRASAPKPQ